MTLRQKILIVGCIFVITTHRLLAPSQEETTATPTPQHSATPKPKGTVKSANEASANSTKKTATPTPTLKRDLFDGTWSGYLKGNDDYRTLFVSGHGTLVTEKSKYGTFNLQATCDGVSLKWTNSGLGWGCSFTLVPNSDGKAAVHTATCAGLFGGNGSWSATFHREK